ncbi:MAG: aminotransferase class V-fold PLP-dependent enzyme [Anaerolineae bacterium]
MIYFDNAATTWPKPPGVAEAVVNFMQNVGGSPGRSGHRLAVEANRIMYDTREALATLFGVADPLRIVFTANVTEALNLVLFGYLRPGDHVVTTSIEHNSVMRPLRYLQSLGVELSVVPCSSEGVLDVADVEKAIQPRTALLVINHASNVVGTIQPIADVGRIARQHGILLLVDAAQTAGAYPIDMNQMSIDLLAFTGHKALFGPQGTGGLCLGERVELGRLRPLTRGGTGSQSELEEQPDFLPDKYESGTANGVGIAGLGAGVRFVLEQGIERIRQHEQTLTDRLLAGLQDIPGVHVYGTRDARRQTACVSFNIEGVEPSDVALWLDDEYAIMCRPGLHCAPSAHRTIGTYPRGTVRFGLSYLNTEEQVDAAIRAVRNIAMKRR